MNDRSSDLASEVDRVFFEQHPHRSYRIWPARDGELPGLTVAPSGWFVIVVRQARPGFRVRVPFVALVIPPDSEHRAHVLFDRLLCRGDRG